MKLIIGLGNPGKNYQNTRHNIGSAAVRELGLRHNVTLKKGLFGSSLSARAPVGNEQCILAVPLSYMNLSGPAVKSLVRKHRIELPDLIVVSDDLDLETGRVKLKTEGSSGGHKGLESVIGCLGTDDFCRLRIGIGRPDNPRVDIADYVLSVFRKNETEVIAQALDKACEALELWAGSGAQRTMNIINR